MPTPPHPSRLSIVQALRGLAALIVVWHHFAGKGLSDLDVGIFKYTAPDGLYGVRIFFVISGFILPYSLWKGGYVRADYGRFILKRIVRLDPPYLASIAIALAAGYLATLSPLYHGVPFSISGVQLLLHLGYLNAFFGKPWIQPVFWTLAIEFQYYLILGIMFPLLRSANRLYFAGFVGLCAVSQCLVFKWAFLPIHWPFFLMGIVAFRYKARIIDAAEAIGWLLAFSCWAGLVSALWDQGGKFVPIETLPVAAIGVISALSIMYLDYGNRVMKFFGDISYSLYLFHVPIGGKIANLGTRFATNQFSALLVALFALAVSIGFAYAMYCWIEKPAQHFAGRIRYGGETSAFASAAETVSVAP